MGAVLLAAIIILALGLSMQGALSHSFYPWECCHDQDCWPTGADAAGLIREPDPIFTRGGWRLHDGTIIPFNQTRPSPDERFHVCRYGGAASGAVIRPAEKMPCLWVPQGGV
jgi:hypothetical protein